MLDVSGELLSQPCVDAGLELALSPTGRLYLEPGPGGYGGLAPARANRIGKAFERDAGTGLLHLGANEPASALPPSLAFGRAFAHLFVTRLCALPDLANQCAWRRGTVGAGMAAIAGGRDRPGQH